MAYTAKRDSGPAVDRIIVGDCLAKLKELPAETAELVFADPPYNLQLSGELRRPDNSQVAGVTEAWDQFADFAAYDAFTRAWLTQARRILKPSGGLWVIGSYHNIFRLGAILQELGFWILNDVIWRKANPMPNFRGRRFTNAHETLIWAARSQTRKDYTFNYSAMKALNGDLQMRSDWILPICNGGERLKDENGAKLHPTQKPEALLQRILLASSNPGDVIVDPFFGTGTTGVVAKRLGRRFIGIERDPQYARAARQRIQNVTPIDAVAQDITRDKRAQPRIPFGALIEHGLINPGDTLTDPDERFAARVRADGSIACRDATGSIHQIGAYVLGSPACNGWTFWRLKRARDSFPIDSLRQKLRAELATA